MADMTDRGLFSRMTFGVFDDPPLEVVDIAKLHEPESDDPIQADLEQGSTGLKRSGGWIHDEWHPKLRGRRAVKVYREMRDNDPTVGAVLYAIESLILQAPWHIEVAVSDPTEEQKEVAEFVRTALFADMSHSWPSFLSEALSMITYGWSFFEVVYKRRDGGSDSRFDDSRIGWAKWAVRGQETLDRWEIDKHGGTHGMHQNDFYTGLAAFIPMKKALLFTFRSHLNSPEGRSGLRNAYRPWYFKKRLEEVEGIGMERDLAGMPVAEAPLRIMSRDASPTELDIRARLFKIVKSIRVNAQMGIVFPSETGTDGKPTGYKLRLLTTGGKKASEIGAAIQRYNQEIAMTLLAQFLFLGMDRTGSFALADNSTALFAVAIGATMDRITSVINRHAIPPLMRLNNIPQENWPVLVHGDIEVRDLAKLAAYIKTLVDAGVLTQQADLEPHAREVAGLPKRGETKPNEEAAEAKPTITMPEPPTQPNGNTQPEMEDQS